MHDLYTYLDIIGDPNNLTYSGQKYHSTGPQNNIDSWYLHPVIAAPRGRKMIIFECYGQLGHHYEYFIIRGANFLPTRLIINNNQ